MYDFHLSRYSILWAHNHLPSLVVVLSWGWRAKLIWIFELQTWCWRCAATDGIHQSSLSSSSLSGARLSLRVFAPPHLFGTSCQISSFCGEVVLREGAEAFNIFCWQPHRNCHFRMKWCKLILSFSTCTVCLSMECKWVTKLSSETAAPDFLSLAFRVLI